MSSMPECQQCGSYVHSGSVLCVECANKRIAERERDVAHKELAEETKIVDRIWDMFGRPTYKELAGRSIYDLISGLQRELAEERALLDGAADLRLLDGIGGIDIDEATAQAMPFYADPADSEEEWKIEWRKQFRVALRVAIDAAGEKP